MSIIWQLCILMEAVLIKLLFSVEKGVIELTFF